MDNTYTIDGMPVIHLEFLTKEELQTANQILKAFEVVGVPFVSVTQNKKKKQIVLNAHNMNNVQELHNIATELKQMPEFSMCDVIAYM